MREIKFRGKRLDNGEWIEGFYLVAAGMAFISVFAVREPVAVDPQTVGQFTGFLDKDGKEIFEGDAVTSWDGEFCQGFWEFSSTDAIRDIRYIEPLYYSQETQRKVIGNIFDNPELNK